MPGASTPSSKAPSVGATPSLRGHTTAFANSLLSSQLRALLHDDATRIRAEDAMEWWPTLAASLTSPPNLPLLLAAALLICGYGVSSSSLGPSWPAPYALLIAAGVLFIIVGASATLVLRRLHRLRWEVHSTVSAAVLEFERGAGVHAPPAVIAALLAGGATAAATTDGVVLCSEAPAPVAGGGWSALAFHEASKSINGVPVFRDETWVRLPPVLLVQGDVIALMGWETAPARVRPVDGAVVGRRSSVSATYRLATPGGAPSVGSPPHAPAPGEVEAGPAPAPPPLACRIRYGSVMSTC